MRILVTGVYGFIGSCFARMAVENEENMRLAVADIQDGNFAKSWIGEHKNGEKKLKKLIKEYENHDLERVGKLIRRMASIENT